MPLPKIEEVRNLSDSEIADAIVAAKRELLELRLQKATRRLEKTHQFRHIKHRIAQLMTVERERQIANAQAASAEAPQPEVQPEEESDEQEE